MYHWQEIIIDLESDSYKMHEPHHKITSDAATALLEQKEHAQRKVCDCQKHNASSNDDQFQTQQESEERYYRLFETSPEPIFIIGLDGIIRDCNQQMAELTGLAKEEIVGKMSLQLGLLPNEDVDKYVSHLAKSISGEEVGPVEVRLTRQDSEVRWLEVYPALLKSGKKACGLQVIIRDISARKYAEKRLQETLNELERSNNELEQFAYIVSHDLQEPLRMVASYCTLLKERYKNNLDNDAHEFIEFAVDGAKRMQGLIGALLQFSRVGTRGKEFTLVDLNVIVRDALNNLQVAIQESDATITFSPLPQVMADATQMVQLFQNLIGNGIKFRGEILPKINITVSEENEVWIFSIKDNGIGIDDQFKHRIFGIFQRLHTRENYPGTGIGLAVCKKIVERHGGRIWVDSVFGNGSIFNFTLRKRAEEEF